MIESTYGVPKPTPTYGKATCATCHGPVSTYTPPQPVTELRQCNRHWSLPSGYCFDADGEVVREEAQLGIDADV